MMELGSSSPISSCAGRFPSSSVTHPCRSFLVTANSSSTPLTLYPSDVKGTEIIWVVGTTLGAFCYGVLLALGLSCLKALRQLPPQAGLWDQRRLLMVHVSLLIVLNAVYQINSTRENVVAIFYTKPEALTYFYLDRWNLVLMFIFALTDGLMVWRCYMVQKSSLQGKRLAWQHLCWIFPLGLWFMSIGIGGASVILADPNIPLSKPLGGSLTIYFLFICITGNILLNIFVTSYIIIRLLIHRRSMIVSFGASSSTQKIYLRTINILLESAIINLPVAGITMAGITLVRGWPHLIWQVSVPAQSFSSVLVIYQIANGRAAGSQLIIESTQGSVN